MPNVFQKPMPNYNSPDTRNIGFQMPGQSGVMWDNDWQKNTGGGTQNAFGGGQQSQTNPLIQNYMTKQTSENARSRAANEGRWNSASGYLKGFATPYDPATIARMKSANAMTAQAGENNAFNEQRNLMAASGQGDASSLAAAAAEANRHSLGARVGADNALDMRTHEANNTAGMNVGTSILNALPQDRPDQLGEFAALGLMGQNQDFQHNLIQNQMDRPISPGMTNSRPSLGGNGGQNPFNVAYNPNGQYNPMNGVNGYGNRAPGNSLTPAWQQNNAAMDDMGNPYAGSSKPQQGYANQQPFRQGLY